MTVLLIRIFLPSSPLLSVKVVSVALFYIMGPLTLVIGTTKIAPPGLLTDECHTRGDSGRPTPTRIACLSYWASSSLSDVPLIVTTLEELFLF